MRRRSPWTLSETLLLADLVRGDWPYARIAAALGRSDPAVRVQARLLGLQSRGRGPKFHRAWTPERDRKLIELYRYHRNASRVAEEMGISYSAVRERLKVLVKQGKIRFSRFWSREEVERLIYYHRSGIPIAEIARAIGRSPAAVERKIERLRKEGKL